MKRFHQAARLLDLSSNELAILDLLPLYRTPLLLAKQSDIPRPTIYVTIEKLHGRGLIQRKKLNNKFFWELSPIEDIEFNISKLRSNVSDRPPITKGKEIAVTKDTRIRILNGKEAMIDIFMSAIKDHKGERLRAIQGENIGNSWDKVLGSATINRINKAIKDNDLITEIITTKRWLELGTKVSGVEWARNFEGRTGRFNFLSSNYLDHDSQIFIFKDLLYIINMPEELFIEIINKKVVKMFRFIFNFIQDTTRAEDGNAILREIIDKNK